MLVVAEASGTHTSPPVFAGAVTWRWNLWVPVSCAHLTTSGPLVVGTCPWVQARSAGDGFTRHVLYPGSTAVAPRTDSVSSWVGPAPHAWARLSNPREGRP